MARPATHLTPTQAVYLVPVEALDGSQCGLACEVCPLRPWKSASVSDILCTEILEQARVDLEVTRSSMAKC